MLTEFEGIKLDTKPYVLISDNNDMRVEYNHILEVAARIKAAGGKIIIDCLHATLPNRAKIEIKKTVDRYIEEKQQVFFASCNQIVINQFSLKSRLHVQLDLTKPPEIYTRLTKQHIL